MERNFDPKSIRTAARVSEFMMKLSQEQKERWDKVRPYRLPHGDLAYGAALMKWYQDGSPKMAFFSYAPEQDPCPYLMEFREEISIEFGLKILTIEEGQQEARKAQNTVTRKVHDWGLN
jgi:hypothetical protein